MFLVLMAEATGYRHPMKAFFQMFWPFGQIDPVRYFFCKKLTFSYILQDLKFRVGIWVVMNLISSPYFVAEAITKPHSRLIIAVC